MNSEATAIARTSVSAPVQWLVDNNYLYGLVCNFGEGKAFKDTEAMSDLPEVGGCFPYEPNSPVIAKRNMPMGCPFNFVVANYVLNTLTPDARAEAFLQAYIAGQYAIFTVRLDRVDGEPFEDGVITKRGTFQKSFSRSECEELGRVLTYNSSFAIIDLY
jgi:hypothetical protein